MQINKLINTFREYLLSSPLKENIAKIILFGSYAKGVATPDSDIDILIVITNGLSIEKPLMDKVYDFMVEHNAPIEVVTSIFHWQSPYRRSHGEREVTLYEKGY